MRTLKPNRSKYALVMLGFLLACGEQNAPMAPRAPKPDASLIDVTNGLLNVTNGLTSLVGDLLVCTLQPEQSSSAVIGPAGGNISFGHHSLDIPRGALNAPTRITGRTIRGYNARVEFSPSGLRFAVPATVRLSYSNCTVSRRPAQVVYLQADTAVTEREPSHDYRDGKWVTASIRHFSSYAVAY
jgi:hypothetical protein